MRRSIVLLALLPAIATAAIQTQTDSVRLQPGSSVSIRGERFDSLVSVDETQRPPGGGVAPAVIGPVAVGTDYVIDAAAGTIVAAPGRAAFWARVVYRWDDTPNPDEAEAVAAVADCDISKPALRARIVQDLSDIQQEMDRATQVQAQMDAQIAAFGTDPVLPASPTAAQLRTAIITLSTRYQQTLAAMRDVAIGAHRSGDRFWGLAKLVECLAGIHIPGGSGFK